MCDCDYERPSMHEVGTSIARKPHKCYECSRAILPGERYERAVGVWAGEFAVFKTCSLCLSLREFVGSRVECVCWGYGNVRCDAIETARYHSEVPGLLFGAWRREALIRREKERQLKALEEK